MVSHAPRSYVSPVSPKNEWVVINAEGQSLGRVSTRIAKLLRGKHKPSYTPNIDTGVYVVVVNADKFNIKGTNKLDKKFFWHTGYPGGIKEEKWGDTLRGKYPERLLQRAVKRMMPKDSRLADKQMGCLKIYAGPNHPHAAQSPVAINLDII
jgi:large subunit ribosomal protein L13